MKINNLVKIPMPRDIHEIKLPSGRLVVCRNLEEAKRIYTDIFTDKIYKLPVQINIKPKRIVDMGAHVGMATLWFAEEYPEAKIESYEPNPFNFQLLAQNTSDLKEKISIFPCAVNTSDDQIYLYLGNGKRAGWTWGGSMIKNHWHKGQNKIPLAVPTRRASDICTSKIDLLKVDIEGLEYELFKSLGDKLYNINIIIFEFHGTSKLEIDSLKKLETLLLSKGFKVIIDSYDKTFDLNSANSIDQKMFTIYAYRC